jgi:NitT/TauT family transport system substrate-binding protein
MRRGTSWWRVLGCLACLVALGAGLAACGGSDNDSGSSTSTGSSSSAGGTSKIRIANVQASLTAVPMQVAQTQGFFKKHQVTVTLDTPTLPFNQLPNALGKQYDLIISSAPNVVNARQNGLDLVLESFLERDSQIEPGAALVVPPDSSIHSIKDLAGKTVGAPSVAGSNWTTLLCWAKKAGLGPKAFRGVEAPTPQIPDLVKKGRFDAALLFQPGYGQLLNDGFRSIGNSYQSCFGERIMTSAFVGLGSWVKSNKPALTRFHAALRDAVQWIDANPDKARQVWLDTSGLPKAVASIAPPRKGGFEINDDRALMLGTAQKWLDVMHDVGVYDGNVKASEMVP